VSLGSPADKAELEVADEILEINGKSLNNSSHSQVITHIHNVSIILKNLSKFHVRSSSYTPLSNKQLRRTKKFWIFTVYCATKYNDNHKTLE